MDCHLAAEATEILAEMQTMSPSFGQASAIPESGGAVTDGSLSKSGGGTLREVYREIGHHQHRLA